MEVYRQKFTTMFEISRVFVIKYYTQYGCPVFSYEVIDVEDSVTDLHARNNAISKCCTKLRPRTYCFYENLHGRKNSSETKPHQRNVMI